MENQFIQEQLNGLHKQGADTARGVNDLVVRFDKLSGWMEKFDNRIDLKADKVDLEKLEAVQADHTVEIESNRRVRNWGFGLITTIILAITAWFTGHPNLPH